MKRKKKAVTKEKSPPPQAKQAATFNVSNIEEFQAAYGQEWFKIVSHPAFQAAIQLLNFQKLEWITGLENKDIDEFGKQILSDLRGHLKLQADLFSLHTQEEFKIPTEDFEYVKPEVAIERERLGG